MESALFAAGEQFAQEARERALRRDEFGYAWDVRDVCADGERGERKRAERRHWAVCLRGVGRRLELWWTSRIDRHQHGKSSPGWALIVLAIREAADDPERQTLTLIETRH